MSSFPVIYHQRIIGYVQIEPWDTLGSILENIYQTFRYWYSPLSDISWPLGTLRSPQILPGDAVIYFLNQNIIMLETTFPHDIRQIYQSQIGNLPFDRIKIVDDPAVINQSIDDAHYYLQLSRL